MTSDIAKKQPLELDSIDDFDDRVVDGDGGAGQSGGGFLPDGLRIKFTTTERWETPNGDDIIGRVVLHLDTIRTEVKWGKDKKPVAPPHVLGPGEQYRDVEAVNEKIPQSEWVLGPNGKLKGPAENQNVVVFGDLGTMERFVWPSPVTTIGSSIAVRELSTKVKRMRQFRGARVFAKVKFSKCLFHTSYGDRQRPHLEIVGWVEPTEHGLAQIDPRLLPSLQPVPAPKTQSDPAPGAREVMEPSLSEEMDDVVKF